MDGSFKRSISSFKREGKVEKKKKFCFPVIGMQLINCFLNSVSCGFHPVAQETQASRRFFKIRIVARVKSLSTVLPSSALSTLVLGRFSSIPVDFYLACAIPGEKNNFLL